MATQDPFEPEVCTAMLTLPTARSHKAVFQSAAQSILAFAATLAAPGNFAQTRDELNTAFIGTFTIDPSKLARQISHNAESRPVEESHIQVIIQSLKSSGVVTSDRAVAIGLDPGPMRDAVIALAPASKRPTLKDITALFNGAPVHLFSGNHRFEAIRALIHRLVNEMQKAAAIVSTMSAQRGPLSSANHVEKTRLTAAISKFKEWLVLLRAWPVEVFREGAPVHPSHPTSTF